MQSTDCHEPTKPDRVRVNRGNGQIFEAVTTHAVFLPLIENGAIVGRGAFIGIEVRDDRGMKLFAMPEQLELVD